MIFDDHDVNDDWNISWSWVEEMRAAPWWDARDHRRVHGVLDLPAHRQPLAARARRGAMLDARQRRRRRGAARCGGSRTSGTASRRRAAGPTTATSATRGCSCSTRAPRACSPTAGARWSTRRSGTGSSSTRVGAFDHLVIASTLPVFLPHGIHHLEAWNEALCDGRWGRARRAARRAAAARASTSSTGRRSTRRSSGCAAGCARSRPERRSAPPATIVAPRRRRAQRLRRARSSSARGASSRVFQIVCSPFRNPLVAEGAAHRPRHRLARLRRACSRCSRGSPAFRPRRRAGGFVRRPTFDELDRRARARRAAPPG